MITIRTLPEFDEWLYGLKDQATKARLIKRLERVANGNLGQVKFARDGVWEMKEDFGKGWRMYYIKSGNTIIFMLGGGNKHTQDYDINKAINLAKTIEVSHD